MNNKIVIIGLLAVFIAQISTVQITLAASPTLIDGNVCDGALVTGDMEAKCIPEYIAFLIGQLFKLTGALALIMVMVGGFEYTLDKLVGGKEKGIKRIRNGILGMIISGFAFFIVRFIIITLRG